MALIRSTAFSTLAAYHSIPATDLDKTTYTTHYRYKIYDKKAHELKSKRKVSLTIDEELYEAIETASKKRRLTKSQVAQEAFRLWLRKQTEALMAKGYEHMADEARPLRVDFRSAERSPKMRFVKDKAM